MFWRLSQMPFLHIEYVITLIPHSRLRICILSTDYLIFRFQSVLCIRYVYTLKMTNIGFITGDKFLINNGQFFEFAPTYLSRALFAR